MVAQSTDFRVLLKYFRGRVGLTQERLAARAGVSCQTVTKLERGVYHTPHIDTLQMLARALELSAQEYDDFVQSVRPQVAQTAPRLTIPANINAFIQGINELHARQEALIDVLISCPTDANTRIEATD